MKIVWITTNLLGISLLKTAMNISKIDCLITLSDKSKMKIYDKIPLGELEKLPISIIRLVEPNDITKILDIIKPDLIFMIGWRRKIDKELLDKYTIIGFHPTLLPYGRGQASIINTILYDIKESGLTMFYMNEGLDSGDIIGQKSFLIDKDETSNSLYLKLIDAGKELIKIYLPKLIENNAPRIKQDEKNVFNFISPKSNEILPEDNIDTMYKKIRAFSKPYNGAYIMKDGKKLIFWEAELIE